MGDKASKKDISEDTRSPVATGKHKLKQYGKESEFWFLITGVHESIDSAEDLHRLILQGLRDPDLIRQIVGVHLDGGLGYQTMGYVYFKDFKSAQVACVGMDGKYLRGHRINTSCVTPSENESKEKVIENPLNPINERIQEYNSSTITEQQMPLDQIATKRMLTQSKERVTDEQAVLDVQQQKDNDSELRFSMLENQGGRELMEQSGSQLLTKQESNEMVLQVQERLLDKKIILEQENKQDKLLGQKYKEEVLKQAGKLEMLKLEEQHKQKPLLLEQQDLLEQQQPQILEQISFTEQWNLEKLLCKQQNQGKTEQVVGQRINDLRVNDETLKLYAPKEAKSLKKIDWPAQVRTTEMIGNGKLKNCIATQNLDVSYDSMSKPYIVVSKFNLELQEEAVRRFFENEGCKGVIKIEKIPNWSYVRVYFESADLALKAVKVMDGFVIDGKKLKVSLGIGVVREMRNNELGDQLDKYIAELEKEKTDMLHKNSNEQKELERLVENLNQRRQLRPKMLPLDEFEQLDEERKAYKQKQEELKNQRKEFECKYKELLDCLLVEAEEPRSVNHKKVMAREFKKFRASLPIYAKRSEVLEIVRKHQVLVLVGETGSGKSTQLAQYLADDSFSRAGTIVVTQPRKIAAVSLARRVAQEYGCFVGEEVGYHVGLDKKVSRKTIIKFVTDRILLNEVLNGSKNLEQYSCILIDEAHERSIQTDLLLALIKQNLPQHPELKLIVTSATLNTEIFRKYFDDCPLVKVQGRAFPVERVYAKIHLSDYVEQTFEKVVEVCESGEEGDILIFLTQQNEIEKTCERLEKKLGCGNNIILPLHGKLQPEDQEKVFEETPKGKRKIVVATNSAETSITINGIRIVIDSGMVKEPSFDPARNMTTLDVKMVSRSSAVQRSGRAGRTCAGKCYCMYTSEEFYNMEQNTKPEILKMNLGMAVLQLLSLGVTNVEAFDFVEAPPRETLVRASASLKQLGALNQDGTLSDLGRKMLELPTEPKLSKALLEGLERGCGDDIVTVAALMASGRDVFYRGDTAEKKDACAIQKQEFCKTSGDLMSALEVYRMWSGKAKPEQNKWCMENALNSKTLRSTRETIEEIKYALWKIKLGSKLVVTSLDLEQDIRKSLLSGYSENIAWSRGHEKVGYTVVLSNQDARIHPSSVLSSLGSQPQWVLFQEMRRTSETFLVNVTPIEFEWLAEVALHMLQFVDEDEIRTSQAIRERIQPLGPALVKSIIGLRGSTLRGIEASVVNHADAAAHARVFCSIECNVDEGFVDIYSPRDSLEFARNEVNTVLEGKRRDLLDGGSEMLISKVGYLKALVGNDMKTRLVLQPGEFCRFDVFVTKEDETCDVDSMDVLYTLKNAGNVTHYSLVQNSYNGKWGNVTYSSPDEAKQARVLVESDASKRKLLVKKIQLTPCRVERLQPQNSTSVTGTRVICTWFPFPSTNRAYLKCNPDLAQRLRTGLDSHSRRRAGLLGGFGTSSNKKTSDVVLQNIGLQEDEYTIAKKIEACGFESELKDISKITVPSLRGGKEVELEVEKQNVLERMQEFGKVSVLNGWVANCQKVQARLVFPNLSEAKKAIEGLNGKTGELGARAVYLEMERRTELICNKQLYHKIKKTVEKIVEKHENVEFQAEDLGRKGMKIKISGNNAEVVQMIGGQVGEMVAAECIAIDDPAVARCLFSGYGRNKLKKIEKDISDAVVQSSLLGRSVQITGTPEAKQQASNLIQNLIRELMQTKSEEISLRGSDTPVGAIRELLKQYGKDLKALVMENEQCGVMMDIRRRKLVLSGSKSDVAKVRVKVENFLHELRVSRHNPSNQDKELCPVCTDEVEQPYRLNVCGHCYCCACITGYITSVFDSVKADTFPQKCLYDSCEYPLTKDDFLAFLNIDQIEQLYRLSLESFVIGSEQYKHCPSPDCSWVYKTTSSPKTFVCPECSARLCRNCGDVPHELFDTCEAYRASRDPSKVDELYDKWVSKADTRECPKCSVMIEKNAGCSHVHCTRCNAHICWKCGKFFSTAERCYDHQNECIR